MSNFKLRTIYFSPAANTIAASPAWTLLGVIPFAAYAMYLNSNSNATVEFSLDGVNPFIFMAAGSGTANPSNIVVNLKNMGIVFPRNTRLFARRINAGVVGNLRVTVVGSSSNSG